MNNDRLITVCDKCKTASCWHGEFMCWDAHSAGTVEIKRSELIKMDRENPCYFSDNHLSKIGIGE